MSKANFTQKQKIAIIKGAKKTTIRYAAKIAGVHYTTVYDWRRQLAAMGEEAFLEYQVSKPGRGIKQISPEKEQAVLKEWKNNPGFGPGQIRNQLRRQRVTISTTSVRKILQANGYKVIKKKPKSESDHRFEASRPLELTQMDILEFYINKLKVYIILLLDDYSRFILGWNLLEKTSMDEVIKVEACNKSIKHELLRQHYFLTVQEARSAIEQWVNNYNYHRTHQGIGGLLVPAERFHGQANQVLSNLNQGIDITNKNQYSGFGIERSVLNLVIDSYGDLTFYLMGKPIKLTGGYFDGKINT